MTCAVKYFVAPKRSQVTADFLTFKMAEVWAFFLKLTFLHSWLHSRTNLVIWKSKLSSSTLSRNSNWGASRNPATLPSRPSATRPWVRSRTCASTDVRRRFVTNLTHAATEKVDLEPIVSSIIRRFWHYWTKLTLVISEVNFWQERAPRWQRPLVEELRHVIR